MKKAGPKAGLLGHLGILIDQRTTTRVPTRTRL